MDFNLFKDIDKDSIVNTFVKASKDTSTEEFTEISLKALKKEHGSGVSVNILPGSNLRKKGCIQQGQVKISSQAKGYDQPLYLVVSCSRKWAKQGEINMQRYALIVTIDHSDPEVDLYNQIKLRTQIAQRIRIR